MSPEQASGEAVDRRSDVYSVGVMIWEAITGDRLFRGMNEVAILGCLTSGKLPSPKMARPDVPAALEAVCIRALERDPDNRYQTADALRLDLLDAIFAADTRATLDELGRVVSDAFAEERARVRDRIAEHRRRQSLRADGSGGR